MRFGAVHKKAKKTPFWNDTVTENIARARTCVCVIRRASTLASQRKTDTNAPRVFTSDAVSGRAQLPVIASVIARSRLYSSGTGKK